MYLKIRGISSLVGTMGIIAEQYQDQEWRIRTLQKAAEFIIPIARQRQDDYHKVHYYYRGNAGYNVIRRRWVGNNRKRVKGAKRGKGTVPPSDKIPIRPGNLDRSFQVLDLPKAKSAYVGPWLPARRFNAGRRVQTATSGASLGGFYAPFSEKKYRNASDFRKAIMEPALRQAAPAIRAYLAAEIAKRMDKIKSEQKLK